MDANAVPGGGDVRKELIDGLKVIRVKSENPLAIRSIISPRRWRPWHRHGSLSRQGPGEHRLLAELKFYQIREPLIDGPEQKLEMLLALLHDRRQKDAQQLTTALRDADWLVSADAKAQFDVRAKAHYLKALAYRNQLKFVEAKKSLEEALKDGAVARLANAKKTDPWLKNIKECQAKLTDPTVYYLPRVARIQAAGYWQMALDELNTALAAIGDDGRLLARRALVRLELIRNDPKYQAGKIAKEDREAIRADAEQAAKTPEAAGEANYVLGMLEEELGSFTLAEQMYRRALKAVEAAKGSAEEMGRIRVALARLLQRERSAVVPAVKDIADSSIADCGLRIADSKASPTSPVVARSPDRATSARPKVSESCSDRRPSVGSGGTVGRPCHNGDCGLRIADSEASPTDSNPQSAIRNPQYTHPLSTMVAALALGAQPGAVDDDEDPAAKARLKESIDIAKELMKSDNPKVKGQGQLLMGQALARQGRRTEGLRLYIEGLKLIHPGREMAELIKMMEEHPIFQQPDATTRPIRSWPSITTPRAGRRIGPATTRRLRGI